MAEADMLSNENEELIAGLEQGDLKPTVYEGGFKTWECSVDLAQELLARNEPACSTELDLASGDIYFVEVWFMETNSLVPCLLFRATAESILRNPTVGRWNCSALARAPAFAFFTVPIEGDAEKKNLFRFDGLQCDCTPPCYYAQHTAYLVLLSPSDCSFHDEHRP